MDYLLFIGTPVQVQNHIEELKNIFEVHIEKKIMEFLGYELIVKNKTIIINQRKITLNYFKNLKRKLNIKNLNVYLWGI